MDIILETTGGAGERSFQKCYLTPFLRVRRWVKVEAGRSPRRLLDWFRQDVMVAWKRLAAMGMVTWKGLR